MARQRTTSVYTDDSEEMSVSVRGIVHTKDFDDEQTLDSYSTDATTDSSSGEENDDGSSDSDGGGGHARKSDGDGGKRSISRNGSLKALRAAVAKQAGSPPPHALESPLRPRPGLSRRHLSSGGESSGAGGGGENGGGRGSGGVSSSGGKGSRTASERPGRLLPPDSIDVETDAASATAKGPATPAATTSSVPTPCDAAARGKAAAALWESGTIPAGPSSTTAALDTAADADDAATEQALKLPPSTLPLPQEESELSFAPTRFVACATPNFGGAAGGDVVAIRGRGLRRYGRLVAAATVASVPAEVLAQHTNAGGEDEIVLRTGSYDRFCSGGNSSGGGGGGGGSGSDGDGGAKNSAGGSGGGASDGGASAAASAACGDVVLWCDDGSAARLPSAFTYYNSAIENGAASSNSSSPGSSSSSGGGGGSNGAATADCNGDYGGFEAKLFSDYGVPQQSRGPAGIAGVSISVASGADGRARLVRWRTRRFALDVRRRALLSLLGVGIPPACRDGGSGAGATCVASAATITAGNRTARGGIYSTGAAAPARHPPHFTFFEGPPLRAAAAASPPSSLSTPAPKVVVDFSVEAGGVAIQLVTQARSGRPFCVAMLPSNGERPVLLSFDDERQRGRWVLAMRAVAAAAVAPPAAAGGPVAPGVVGPVDCAAASITDAASAATALATRGIVAASPTGAVLPAVSSVATAAAPAVPIGAAAPLTRGMWGRVQSLSALGGARGGALDRAGRIGGAVGHGSFYGSTRSVSVGVGVAGGVNVGGSGDDGGGGHWWDSGGVGTIEGVGAVPAALPLVSRGQYGVHVENSAPRAPLPSLAEPAVAAAIAASVAGTQ